MPQVKSSDDLTKFVPITAGEHILTLTKVEEREQPNIFAEKDDDGMYTDTGTTEPPIRQQFLWVFESDTKKPDGESYVYTFWTGRYYGDSRAKLTDFLNSLLPDSSDDEKKHIDTDSLISARFRVRIALKKNTKGQERPTHTLIEPAPAPAGVASAPVSAPTSKSIPVADAIKTTLGTALAAAKVKEGEEKLKARLFTELGRRGYKNYTDFIDRGGNDALAILKFVSPDAFSDDNPFA